MRIWFITFKVLHYEGHSRGTYEQRENYVNKVGTWHNFTNNNISTKLQRETVTN